jgi:hypothetical protein
MSEEDFVKFYEQHVLKSPDLQAQLEGAKDRPHFAKIAIDAGSKLGLEFTDSEIGAVMNATEQKLGAALSDDQLEGVVGGADATVKTTSPTIAVKTLPKVQQPISKVGTVQSPQGPIMDPGKAMGGCW